MLYHSNRLPANRIQTALLDKHLLTGLFTCSATPPQISTGDRQSVGRYSREADCAAWRVRRAVQYSYNHPRRSVDVWRLAMHNAYDMMHFIMLITSWVCRVGSVKASSLYSEKLVVGILLSCAAYPYSVLMNPYSVLRNTDNNNRTSSDASAGARPMSFHIDNEHQNRMTANTFFQHCDFCPVCPTLTRLLTRFLLHRFPTPF